MIPFISRGIRVPIGNAEPVYGTSISRGGRAVDVSGMHHTCLHLIANCYRQENPSY
jgi:hypothetical protein